MLLSENDSSPGARHSSANEARSVAAGENIPRSKRSRTIGPARTTSSTSARPLMKTIWRIPSRKAERNSGNFFSAASPLSSVSR